MARTKARHSEPVQDTLPLEPHKIAQAVEKREQQADTILSSKNR
jgi:hypothetical protein